MMTDIMIDLETMGDTSDAAIVSIGAVKFSPYATEQFTEAPFYRVIDLKSSLDAGLKASASTINWWLKQSDAARKAITEPSITLFNMLDELSVFVKGADYIWSQGSDFDLVILTNAYRLCRLDLPWKSYQQQDTRTVYRMAGKRSFDFKQADKHNALSDAIAQARNVQQCFNILGLSK